MAQVWSTPAQIESKSVAARLLVGSSAHAAHAAIAATTSVRGK
jgi:hypothetical protein